MNRTIWLLAVLLAMVGCHTKNPLSEIKVDPSSSEINLELELTQKRLEYPPISFRWCELEPREGLIEATWRGEKFYVQPDCVIENKHIESVFADDEWKDDPKLMFAFSPEGAELLEHATSEPSELQLALVVEGHVEIVCKVTSKMGRHSVLSGLGSHAHTQSIAYKINKHIDNSALVSEIRWEMFYKRLVAVGVVSIIAVSMICFVLLEIGSCTKLPP